MIAFISVSDKSGVRDFAQGLAELGYDIYSTGGTRKHLVDEGLTPHSISDLTGFPEILGGRVKSVHPALHGGVLARRDVPEHMDDLNRSEISPIGLVCVNLYPFVETVTSGAGEMECLEQIDIGGPAIVRAAAKNHPFVLVLVDPTDYGEALEKLRAVNGDPEKLSADFRRGLATKAFQHTASYDTAVADYLRRKEVGYPQRVTVALDKALDLRYGENPHQKAALYRRQAVGVPGSGIMDAERLHGLELSYINVMDADAALQAVMEFDEPAVVILKHANPCGIASHEDIAEAYKRAFDSDPVSPFGGIIATNRSVTDDMVAAMKGMRYDVMVAPDYGPAALERLRKRRDLRILRTDGWPPGRTRPAAVPEVEYRTVAGGMLVQETDRLPVESIEMKVVTKREPTASERADMTFAWRAVKHVKSNAIVVARDRATVGIGAGQQNRKAPVEIALARAGEKSKGSVLASDAFFPFARDDAVEIACRAGVTAIIQPGGAVRDDEAVEVCDEYGVTMLFTATRAFRH
jgi:phosphoribosylaminoimidazolecarboxamide formyltransferase/IMP cyclohydrolase